MARKKNEPISNPAVTDNETVQETIEQTPNPAVTDNEAVQETIEQASKASSKIPENVLKLMQLYPQYEKIYVTPKGFVHPENAPSYLTDGATLYKNEFYKS